jgi:hypothetical protein
MDEDEQQKIIITDFQHWDYPEFDEETVEELIHDEETLEEEEKLAETHVDVVIHQDIEDHFIQDAVNDHTLDIIDDKLQYLDAIGAQINQRLSEIDAEFFQIVTGLVKQTVKKIILKELNLDEQLLIKMVSQSLEKINTQKAPSVVHISPEDAVVFEKHPDLEHVKISINPELSRGSFIINTQFSELQAILDHRLTAIFGI